MASIDPTTDSAPFLGSRGSSTPLLQRLFGPRRLFGPQRLSVPQRILLAQLFAGLAVVAMWVLVDPRQWVAAVLGLAVVLLPNAWLAFQFSRAQSAGREVGQAMAKLVITLGLVVLVFVVVNPSAAGFFSTLVVCSLTQIVAPALLPSMVQAAKLATAPTLPLAHPLAGTSSCAGVGAHPVSSARDALTSTNDTGE